jgi:putative ABC transport system permease protein
MIRNLFVMFVRNLLRKKLFSAINLLGLTVSITATILIYLYVSYEFSYDGFHRNSERLFRVNQTFIWGEDSDTQFSRTGPGVAHALKEELANVELVTSLHTPGSFIISYTTAANEIVSFEETEVLAADTNFFKVLNFPLLKGDANSAFRHANTLMLTRSTAAKYFGDSDPLGKIVRLGLPNGDETQTFEVTGVLDDVPDNSTIQFDVLLSSNNFAVEKFHWSWVWTQLETFVLLRENYDFEKVTINLAQIPKKRAEETLQKVMNTSYEEYIASGKKWELFLQPIESLHLPVHPVLGSFPDTGNLKIIYALIGAAVFIILLSCVNFMNLSTAQFTRRVKEAAVRKILGLGKLELGGGYFFEALIFCLVALVIAIAFTQVLLPIFNMLTGKELAIDSLLSPTAVISLVILVGLMAGISSIYPAVFLSSFRPTEAMKGKIKTGNKDTAFRNGLVIFQFSVSLVLIICTGVVFQQLKFVSEKDLGFNRENVIRIKHAEGVKNPESLVKALENIPGVVRGSLCTSTPPEFYGGDKFKVEGSNNENFSLNYTTADEHYIPTLGIRLKYGRNFSESNPSDVNGVILNEASVKTLGWNDEESIVGKKIYYPGAEEKPFEVLGVVSDFNYWSLATAIEPMAIFHINNHRVFDNNKNFIALRINAVTHPNWEKLNTQIASTWEKHAGDLPFEFGFIDDYFAEAFKTQERFGYVLFIIAGLAIVIAGLGLLGIIIFALEQRTKEIGIRKVSGASSWNILSLISVSYLRLIAIAFVIGAPCSYYMMNAWLKDFSYRVVPSVWIFVVAGVFTITVAALIVCYHSMKAARMNPVDVLKDE